MSNYGFEVQSDKIAVYILEYKLLNNLKSTLIGEKSKIVY